MNTEVVRKIAADLRDVAAQSRERQLQKTANKLDSKQVYNFIKFFGGQGSKNAGYL